MLVSERVNVADIVASAVEIVQPLLGEEAASRIERRVQELFVRGDPVRLTQVVGNLLHNAAKYTGEGGSILLTHG